jgi:type VI secretion system secreted protein VgrG
MPDQDKPRGLLSVTSHEFNCKTLPGLHWHVRRFTLDEALSEPYRLSLELLIDESELDAKVMLGAACDLQISRDDDLRVVHGIVERIVELGAVADRLAFQVDLVPAFALRAQSVDTRFFQDMSVPEIVEAVLTAPLEGVDRTLRLDLEAGDFEKREYCVQYRESDFEFVSRLLQEEGIVYYFEHPREGEGEVLVLVDDTATCPELDVGEGGGAKVLYIDRSVGTNRLQSVDSLTPTHSLRTTAIVQRDFDWKKPSESPYEHQRRSKEAPGGERETYDHNDRRLFRDDGARRARRKLEQRSLQSRVLRGSSDVIEFIPGLAFELVGHPQHALDNEYLLVRVRHRGEAPEEDMFVQEGADRAPRYTNEFECIERDVPWRPEPMFAKRRAHGLQTAIVTGPESEEIHTDAHGRIKVRFHWDRISPFDDTSSCWVRVVQRWSGAGWGAMILPRIGMEVIVEFVDGDPDRPIVTGCVYNGDHPPPYPLPDEKTKSTLKSDSSPGGGGFNEFRFEDAKGREEIFLHAQKDLNEVILNNMSTSVGHDQTLSVRNDRTKTITGFETQTVHKDRNTTIDGSENLHIKGSLNMTVDGGAHKGRGPDPAALGSGVTVTGEYNIIATKKLTITVGASKLIMDTSHISLETTAEMKLTVGGSSIKLVPAQIDVASPTIIETAKGSSLKLDAAAELKSGATVKIHGDGVVTIEGSTIKLNS